MLVPKLKKTAGGRKLRKNGDFPIDVLADILFQLLSSTVLRFKLISKSWYALISYPNFINLYSKKVSPNPKILLSLTFSNHCEFRLLDYESPSFNPIGPLSIPRETCDVQPFKLIGSNFGLVCVATSHCGGFYIWNPTTREFKKVMDFDSSRLTRKNGYLHGFGYDPVSNDFKIVISFYPVSYVAKLLITYNVYSLKNNSWKKIVSPLQYYYNPGKFPTEWQVSTRPSGYESYYHLATNKEPEKSAATTLAMVLNGIFHWLVRVSNEFDPHIIAFDSSRKTFRKLRTPDEKIGKPQMPVALDKACGVVTLLDHNGCLCLFCSADASMDAKEIWVMKEYGDYKSWTHFLNVFGSAGDTSWSSLYKPLHVTIKNEVVIYTTNRLTRWFSGEAFLRNSTNVGAREGNKTGEYKAGEGTIYRATLIDETLILPMDFVAHKSMLLKWMSNCFSGLKKFLQCCTHFCYDRCCDRESF